MKPGNGRIFEGLILFGIATAAAAGPAVAQGTRTLFSSDFSTEKPGEFPKSLHSTPPVASDAPMTPADQKIAAELGALMEMVSTITRAIPLEPRKPDLVTTEWRDRRWVSVPESRSGYFYLPLPERMPERITIEFDATVGEGWRRFNIGDRNWSTNVEFGWSEWANAPVPGEGWLDLRIYTPGMDVRRAEGRPMKLRRGDVFRGRITIDGKTVSAAVNDTPLAEFHESGVERPQVIGIQLAADDDALHMTDIRVLADQ